MDSNTIVAFSLRFLGVLSSHSPGRKSLLTIFKGFVFLVFFYTSHAWVKGSLNLLSKQLCRESICTPGRRCAPAQTYFALLRSGQEVMTRES